MISVLLATYNGDKYIKLAIESILNQTFKDFELLVGLNGENTTTKEILRTYNDDRIRVFDYGDEMGKALTLNKLLIEAKYEWVAIQDDDDIWIEKKLMEQIKETERYSVIGTFIDYIDKSGNIIGSPELKTTHDDIVRLSVSGNNQMANSSVIFRKSDALKIGGWCENIDGIEDYDFWLRLMDSGKYFVNIPKKLVLHRVHQNSKFNTNIYDIDKIINRYNKL